MKMVAQSLVPTNPAYLHMGYVAVSIPQPESKGVISFFLIFAFIGYLFYRFIRS